MLVFFSRVSQDTGYIPYSGLCVVKMLPAALLQVGHGSPATVTYHLKYFSGMNSILHNEYIH